MNKKIASNPKPASAVSQPKIYHLKVTLADVDPPLWRRLEVEGDLPIDFISGAIRGVFGWSPGHQSEFTIKGRRYGDPTDWARFDPEQEYDRRHREIIKRRLKLKEERRELEKMSAEIEALSAANETEEDFIPLLCELVPRVRTKFKFLFDFGDCWEHNVEVEKIAPAEPDVRYPRCTDGAGADPIEDCGGAWRLTELMNLAKTDPRSSRLQEYRHIIPENWRPEQFSVEEINRRLAEQFRNSE